MNQFLLQPLDANEWQYYFIREWGNRNYTGDTLYIWAVEYATNEDSLTVKQAWA